MNNPQTVHSVTHQLWLPIPQETARPRKLPLSLNMEGEDKESPALADNHQAALPERAHSPATDHLMCSSNQTATVRSTTYADVAQRLSLIQQCLWKCNYLHSVAPKGLFKLPGHSYWNFCMQGDDYAACIEDMGEADT